MARRKRFCIEMPKFIGNEGFCLESSSIALEFVLVVVVGSKGLLERNEKSLY